MKTKCIKHIQNGYTVEVTKSVEEIEAIRPIWERMQRHPNADIDFYLTILDSRSEILHPHIMVLYLDESPKAMMIGRIEQITLDLKIGYKTILRSRMRLLTIIYGGLLGDMSQINADILVSELMDSLDRGEADAVLMSSISLDSGLYELATTKPRICCRDHASIPQPHWAMKLPLTIDEFLKKISSKHRYWIRRVSKMLEKEHLGKVSFELYTDEDQIAVLCRDVEPIAKKTYQRGLGAGFVDNDENRKRLALSARNKWLRAYLLYVDGVPRAFWIGTLYQNTFHLDFTGYDPDYSRYEPGTILFVRMIEDLCNNKIENVDFGFGDALYKDRFADYNWKEASVHIFASTMKGIWINAIRTLLVFVSKYAKLILEKTKLVRIIKKGWRNRLKEK